MCLALALAALPGSHVDAATSPLSTVFNDGDLDGIYFSGNPFSVTITGFPFPAPSIKVVVGVFTSLEAADFSKKVLAELTPFTYLGQTVYATDLSVAGGSFTVSGTVTGNDLTTGVIGLKILDATGATELIPGMAMGSMTRSPLVGVRVPSGEIVVQPSLDQVPNLNSCPEMTFTKVGYGSIIFPAGLDIITYREQLAALQTGVNITFDVGTHTLSASIDGASLTFLQNKGAEIQFPSAMGRMNLQGATAESFRDFIMVSVMQNSGLQVPQDEMSGYIDPSQMSYANNIDLLRMPVKHFTKFSVNPKQSGQAPALSSLPASTIIFGNKAYDLSLLNDNTMVTEILAAFVANSNHFVYKMLSGSLMSETGATVNAGSLVPLQYKNASKTITNYQ